MSVVDTVEILKGRPLTDPEYLQAAVLGWGVEFVCLHNPPTYSSSLTTRSQLEAFLIIADDIMDSSTNRRGKPCWYRNKEVSLIAINDAFMLESAIYYLLKKHFKKESYYVDLLELFHETTYQTEFGQLIDLITAPEDSVDLTKFSLEK